METNSKNRLILSCITIGIGIILLVTLALPVITADIAYRTNNYYSYSGYYYIESYLDTGFTLLGFKSNLPYMDSYKSVIVAFGIVSLIELLLSIAIIAIGTIGCIIRNEKTEKLSFIFTIIGFSYGACFALFGIIYAAIYGSFSAWDESSRTAFTYSWIGFLLCGIGFTVYMTLRKIHFRDAKPIEKTVKATAPKSVKSQPISAGEKITLLKQYKELLDSGIITQEEFENKKKEIL